MIRFYKTIQKYPLTYLSDLLPDHACVHCHDFKLKESTEETETVRLQCLNAHDGFPILFLLLASVSFLWGYRSRSAGKFPQSTGYVTEIIQARTIPFPESPNSIAIPEARTTEQLKIIP